MTNTRRPDRAFNGTAALVFGASVAVTVAWCGSMSAMPGMEMPGGWTMSMAWMRMPGQSWSGAAATFLGMWSVMMIAMMLPVFTPALARYRTTRRDEPGIAMHTACVATGYFATWTLVGAVAYPIGAAIAEATMRSPELSRAVPFATGLVMMVAGLLQFTTWKARQLASCRRSSACCGEPQDGNHPMWHGMRLGIQCVRCCLGPTAVLLVIGVMDLRAMAIVTLVVCAERLAPAPRRVTRMVGTLFVMTGLFLIQQS